MILLAMKASYLTVASGNRCAAARRSSRINKHVFDGTVSRGRLGLNYQGESAG